MQDTEGYWERRRAGPVDRSSANESQLGSVWAKFGHVATPAATAAKQNCKSWAATEWRAEKGEPGRPGLPGQPAEAEAESSQIQQTDLRPLKPEQRAVTSHQLPVTSRNLILTLLCEFGICAAVCGRNNRHQNSNLQQGQAEPPLKEST